LITGWQMVAERSRCSLNTTVLVIVGLHAVGRWFQRTHEVGEPELLSGLRRIGEQYDTLIEVASKPPHHWTCDVVEGRWLGEAVTHKGRPILAVNTFV